MLCKHCKAREQDEQWFCQLKGNSVLPQMCDNVNTCTGAIQEVRKCHDGLAIQYIYMEHPGWMCLPCLRQRDLKHSTVDLATWCNQCDKGG